MRLRHTLPLLAALAAAACAYVERERPVPAATVVQPAPGVVQTVPASPPPSTVTVRPAY